MYYSSSIALHVVPVEIVPDYNRDGKIDDDDRDEVTTQNPWRFWINDDDDFGDTGGDDIPGVAVTSTSSGGYATHSGPDWTESVNGYPGSIDGTRDLVDFFPVFLDIKQLINILPPGPKAVYKLKQANSALNFAYADVTPDEAGSYLTDLRAAQSLQNTETVQITSSGVELISEFLNKIKNDGKGVILLEGRARILAADNKPLILAVRNESGATVVEVSFQLSIDGVETMFRHKNLLAAGGGTGGPSDRLDAANYPDRLTNNKAFVMVHGYNVNAESARGWGAEMFKRLYWTGSRAKFYNVTWYGSETQIGGSLRLITNAMWTMPLRRRTIWPRS